MTSATIERLASLSGVAFLVLLVSAFMAHAAIGAVDGEPAEAWGRVIEANGHMAQLSGYLHGLAGLSLAVFTWTLLGAATGRVGAWGRFAGLAWAASFLLGGAVIFAAAELASYQQHPEGAKTALALGHLLYANPLAALLGGAFALAVGLARPAWMPAWFRPWSLALGGLGMAVTLLGGVGGIGLVGMAPLALWLLVAAVLAPWRAWRSRAATAD